MQAAGGLDIADAFSTDLYTGNNTSQTITNGIDLSTKGGLVWTKSRSSLGDNGIGDSARGVNNRLVTNTDAASGDMLAGGITSFNSTGFSIGNYGYINSSGVTHVAWTFRKAPKFFDVVTYTGTGGADNAGRYIDHSLESTAGMIIVKRTDSAQDWTVGHQTYQYYYYLSLNKIDAQAGGSVDGKGYVGMGNDTQFWLSNGGSTSIANDLNTSGATYVAYIFAHDTDASGVVQCGSYTGNGSTTGPVVTLGWEPQWLLIKRLDGSGSWYLQDNVRNTSNPRNSVLFPNANAAEQTFSSYDVDFTSTGFQILSSNVNAGYNTSGGTYIYMAIRKEGA
jgi:hypothetical protein